MLRWRIYYSDGSTVCDMAGDPSEAPWAGVACIAQADEAAGRVVLHGYDFYVLLDRGDRWVGVDLVGLLTYVCGSLYRVRAVVCGLMLLESEFEDALARAEADSDLPPRCARRVSESGL